MLRLLQHHTAKLFGNADRAGRNPQRQFLFMRQLDHNLSVLLSNICFSLLMYDLSTRINNHFTEIRLFFL